MKVTTVSAIIICAIFYPTAFAFLFLVSESAALFYTIGIAIGMFLGMLQSAAIEVQEELESYDDR